VANWSNALFGDEDYEAACNAVFTAIGWFGFSVTTAWGRAWYLERLGSATRPVFGLLWDVE
jgi:hypothetical protein